jgi:hypothetical protein
MSRPSLTPLRGGTVGIGMIAGRRRDLFADPQEGCGKSVSGKSGHTFPVRKRARTRPEAVQRFRER